MQGLGFSTALVGCCKRMCTAYSDELYPYLIDKLRLHLRSHLTHVRDYVWQVAVHSRIAAYTSYVTNSCSSRPPPLTIMPGVVLPAHFCATHWRLRLMHS